MFCKNKTNTIICLTHSNALHHWSNFQTKLTTFQWVTSKKPPRSSLKFYFLLVWNYLKFQNSKNSLINFVRILWFVCNLGLVLFDSQKDKVSGKNFSFWQYFGFFGVSWVQKWTKIINVGCALLPLKHLILKDCLEAVFFLWKTHLWLKFQQTRVIFAGERAQKPS